MRRSIKKPKKVEETLVKKNKWVIIGGVVLGIAALFGLLALSFQDTATIHGLQHYLGLERNHDENVVYDISNGLPPAGGVHSARWQNCGIYDQPVEMKHAVHSLEHGAVWLTYHPDLPQAQVEKLRRLARGEAFVLMSLFPDQASPIVLTAWGLQLQVENADDRRIANFIQMYQLGPQTPERGATCRGGVGEPLS